MSAGPNRVLAIIIGTVAVLVVAAVVVIAVRPAPTFDPATPEGAVQGYLQAVLAGDGSAAAGYIDPQSGCVESDIVGSRVDGSRRVVLRDSNIDGDTARVDVEMIISMGRGPFDSYEYSRDHTFYLVDSGSRWLLTGEPWPVYVCSGGKG